MTTVKRDQGPSDSVAPVMFGQTMHHETNFKYWYLHVWAWTDNPEGIYANFNPNVGVLFAMRAYPAGKNSGASITPAIAINIVH